MRWRIPIRARPVDGGAEAMVIMEKDSPARLRVQGCGPVVVNSGQAGYFRTLYPPSQLARLRARFPGISEVDLLGLLSDASALGGVGLIPATSFLDLEYAVPVASDPVIWTEIASKLAEIDRVFDGSTQQADWRGLARKRIQPQFDRVGWIAKPGQGDTTALLRERLITSLGALDDEAVVAESRARFLRSESDPSALPAAIRQPALQVAARHADEAVWQQMLERARKETNPVEKQRMYVRLGMALDASLAQRALDLALSGEPPATVSPAIISAVSVRHPGLAFDFAVANEKAVLAMVEASSRYSYIPQLARYSDDPAVAKRLREYMERSIPESGRQDAAMAIAEIERRARSYAYARPELEAWVKARTEGGCKACRATRD